VTFLEPTIGPDIDDRCECAEKAIALLGRDLLRGDLHPVERAARIGDLAAWTEHLSQLKAARVAAEAEVCAP